jgi:hypothetical protein
MEKKMRYVIGEVQVEAKPQYPRCQEQLEKYRDQNPWGEEDMDITVPFDDIEAYRFEGKDSPLIVDWSVEKQRDEVEYMLMGASYYRQLLKYSGMLLHASAVVVDGKAYLFSGKSGAGKSTHTALWVKHFGADAYILNEDKPAIRFVDGRLYAYGTPWSGKTNQNVNAKVPVAGIVFLGQAPENKIRQLDAKEAFTAIFEQTQRNLTGVEMGYLLSMLDGVIGQYPIYHMDCTISDEAVLMAWRAVNQK